MRHLLFALITACLTAPASADPLESKRASIERLDAATGQGAVAAPTETRRIGNQAGTNGTTQVPLPSTTRANETSGNTTSMSSQVMNSNVRVNVGR